MKTPQADFAALNGTQFYYETEGAASPLLLVHAGICDLRMWDAQFSFFAQSHRVIRYDLRGYGKTAPVDGVYAHHTDLLALLDYLDIERAALIGSSMGGTTVIDFALTYPDRVAALIPVCCEPSGFVDPVDEPLPPWWEAYRAASQAGDLAQVNEYELQLWVDGLQRSPQQVDAALREQVRKMNGIALRNEALGLGQSQPLQPPAAQRLAEIQTPTLIVIGDLDYPSMVRAAEQMATTIPGAQKVVMPGTAHLPNLEQPDRFNERVFKFLTLLDTGRN